MSVTLPEFLTSNDGDYYFPVLSCRDERPSDRQLSVVDEPAELTWEPKPVWMSPVHVPDGYESREEWESSIDFRRDWWEGCAAPINAKQWANCAQFWVVRYRPAEDTALDETQQPTEGT